MLTLASTMKASTGSSTLASTQQWRRIHRRMYSSPGLPRMPLGRTMPMRPPGRSHSTDRSMNRTSGATAFCVVVCFGPLAVVRRLSSAAASCVVLQDRRVGDRDVRAERRIGHQHVDRAERDRASWPGRCPAGGRAETPASPCGRCCLRCWRPSSCSSCWRGPGRGRSRRRRDCSAA